MTVVPFKRKRGGGEPPREAPQIDREALEELLREFLDRSGYVDHRYSLHKRIELYHIANRLGDVLQQFAQPPKGAV
ncbi:hypothetical protein ACFSKY_07840 [Azotobacter chroococcum]|uniref:Uncharacterized protein n=1 Tax=Azotobacter chroococcum TaxID=353 RepID=A0A4R1PI41_9GAMM|nr:hypothetical protein [Azotobacter chroococcum]TBV97750.1 hypothetical protein E0E53_08285 [Azotobacter chroococcum]TCL28177.1 hypothetical protein EV691_12262 [Azotobacter chroococcum]